MPLTISMISFLAIMANNLKLTFTNLYFFKMILSNRLFFLLLPQLAAISLTLALQLGLGGSASAFVGVATGSAWATGVIWEGGASLEGSIT